MTLTVKNRSSSPNNKHSSTSGKLISERKARSAIPLWFPRKSLSTDGLFSKTNNKNNVISSQRLQQECINKNINIEDLRAEWLCTFDNKIKSKPKDVYELLAAIFLIIRYLDNVDDSWSSKKTPKIKGIHQELLIKGIIALFKYQYPKEAELFDENFIINLLIVFAHIKTPNWKTTLFGMTPPPPEIHDDLTKDEIIFISYLVNQVSGTYNSEDVAVAKYLEKNVVKSDISRKEAITALKNCNSYIESIEELLFDGMYKDSPWLHGLFKPNLLLEVEPSSDPLLEKKAPPPPYEADELSYSPKNPSNDGMHRIRISSR